MATLLILEDEPQLASFLTRGLNAEGHQCHHAATLTEMAEKLKSVSPDLAIIDRMLGADDSLYSLPTWRKRHPDLLFLMLTALGDTEERIEGLRHGADDYLAKPFDFDELLARIDALLRRRPSSQSQTDKVQYHQLTLEPAKQRVWLQAQELQLTTLEFLLLKFFIERPETVLSRERILSQVWSTQNDPLTNVVDVYINRLRKKLAENASPSSPAKTPVIETIRGRGYRLIQPAE